MYGKNELVQTEGQEARLNKADKQKQKMIWKLSLVEGLKERQHVNQQRFQKLVEMNC